MSKFELEFKADKLTGHEIFTHMAKVKCNARISRRWVSALFSSADSPLPENSGLNLNNIPTDSIIRF